MFTRIKFRLPIYTGDARKDFDNLNKAITDHFQLLEQKNALQIDSAQIRAASGVQYPASQGGVSTDPNTLDDYAEATYTPTLTANTGTFTSASAAGTYTKIGRVVIVRVRITITTNGTAAGNTQFTLPFTPAEQTALCGIESASTGFAAAGYFKTDGKGLIVKYDGTYLGANGYVIDVAGAYRI